MTNINDIAEQLSLSATTVSRVLNGKAEQYRIGKETQKRVKELAVKLNYVPNEFASNLRSGKSNTIALSVPSISNSFFARIASDLDRELRALGYLTIMTESDETPEIEIQSLRKLNSRNIEGLMIAPSGSEEKMLKELNDLRMPMVCIDRYFENSDIPYVATDNFYGGYEATKLLISYGHRHIACIQGDKDTSPNQLRVAGYLQALKEAGIQDKYLLGNSFDEQNGYFETKFLLKQNSPVSAIFTMSNTIAIGTLRALKEENIKIPDEISLITFDDNPFLELLTPSVSCVAQSVVELSNIAIKLMMAKINKETLFTSQILVKPKIIIRDSIIKV